jgi:hypothetical protein
MIYYLDCEFDGYGGELISMGIVREDGYAFYGILNGEIKDEWVRENVVPKLLKIPFNDIAVKSILGSVEHFQGKLEEYFKGATGIQIIADWPDDFKYFCDALITGPGTMIDIPGVAMVVARVDPYPTDVEGAIQHNAYWDALALKDFIAGDEADIGV